MALTGYDNVLELTIDSSKVDSDLSNFPVLIALSSGTGINSFDATPVFDELYQNDGKSFTNFEAVLSEGSEGTYDTTAVDHPSIIKDGSTYKMWYSGRDNSNVWRIIYCDSTDGKTWSNHQMVVDIGDEGTYDTSHSYSASVVKDGETYKMWYAGNNGSKITIIYCDSSNGTAWSNHQMVVDAGDEGTYDTINSHFPHVIKDGETYKMWYGGYSGSPVHVRIIYCDSSNGTTWSNHQMVVDIGDEGTYDTTHASSPSVIKINDTYKMWYGGYNGSNYRIIYCDSTDGINWSNHQMSIDIGDEGTYDTTHAAAPVEINDSGQIKLWYLGAASDNTIIYTEANDCYSPFNKKIAITDSNDNQLYTEIESWDCVGERAYLWVKVPTISSETDTKLYLYYDATVSGNTTYVGDTGDTAAQNVWDSDFEQVYHMSQDPNGDAANAILDSTSNARHMTPAGSMTSADLVDSQIGKGIAFDGSNDYLYSGDDFYSDILTVEVTTKFDNYTKLLHNLLIKRNINLTPVDPYEWQLYVFQGGDWYFGPQGDQLQGNSTLSSTSSYYYLTGVCEGNGNNVKVYFNGESDGSKTQTSSITNTSGHIQFGCRSQNDDDRFFQGIAAEARISSTARSDAWIKATYYSNFDDLVSYSGPEVTAYPRIYVGGQWVNVNGVWIYIDGQWRTVNDMKIYIQGAWRSLV